MRARFLVVMVIVGLIAVGCSGATEEPGSSSTTVVDSTTSSTTTTSAPTTSMTTSSTTTTTTSSSTTTTEPPSTTTTSVAGEAYHPVQPIPLAPPDPLPGSEGASGSGCAPGSDDLPDGVWFVFVTAILPDAIQGDLACFWFGEIAYEVGEALGEEVANDFIITNDSDRIRTVPVAPDAVAWSLGGDTTDPRTAVPYAEWPTGEATYVDCPGDFCIVWLYVNGGVVTDVVEQYIP